MDLSFIFIIYICFYLIQINGNYILIPIDSMIYNPKKDNAIKEDALSSLFSEDIYFNLTIGNPKQVIKVLIRLDHYELRIKEPNYISSLSDSFKYYLINKKIICKENFYFTTLNTLEDLNNFIHSDKTNKHKKEKELIREYKNVSFVYLNDTTNNRFIQTELIDYDYNKILKYNYGILGLRNRKYKEEESPQFVESLKELKKINTSIFSFIFNKDKNVEHLGYLIIGDKYIDKKTKYEEVNKTNFALRKQITSWDLDVETIYSQSNKENLNSFYERNINIELRVELSFILASRYYKNFIDKEFFKPLVEKNICKFKHLVIDWSYETYVCDGKSSLFLDYYNNKFPDLVFAIKNIDDKLILTKEDLFFHNPNNKSDTNIYFRIYFHNVIATTWRLGRIFLQKYRFSFDCNENIIYYHKSKIINNAKENTIVNDNNNYQILKIILVIFFCLTIFILGILFHKSIIKLPRKAKANELDDGYYYQKDEKNNNLNNDLDINNENIYKNGNNLLMELGTKIN